MWRQESGNKQFVSWSEPYCRPCSSVFCRLRNASIIDHSRLLRIRYGRPSWYTYVSVVRFWWARVTPVTLAVIITVSTWYKSYTIPISVVNLEPVVNIITTCCPTCTNSGLFQPIKLGGTSLLCRNVDVESPEISWPDISKLKGIVVNCCRFLICLIHWVPWDCPDSVQNIWTHEKNVSCQYSTLPWRLLYWIVRVCLCCPVRLWLPWHLCMQHHSCQSCLLLLHDY